MSVIVKPKLHIYGWYDMEQYMALHAKLAARYAAVPAQEPEPEPRKGRWKRLDAHSPAMALLRFLADYQRQHGQMPTTRDIACEHLLTPHVNKASYALSALENGGWIERKFGEPRGIHITAAGRAALEEVA